MQSLNSLIYAAVEQDLEAVNVLISEQLYSQVDLVQKMGEHIVTSGGKRLRPVVLLLTARACSYQGPHHIGLASAVEIIHTATLLHDDVVDDSQLRRGRSTTNALWGNSSTILVGDFLYSRAFQLMVRAQNLEILRILSDASNVIAEGEVMQLLNRHNADTTETFYLEIIYRKTAKLFESAAQAGALIANASAEQVAAMTQYGKHLGMAFQLIDDVLDYDGNSGEMGKNVGDDLAEGKVTLPLIYAMKQGNPEQVALINQGIRSGGLEQLDQIIAAVKATGALSYTEALAQTEAHKAIACLEALPASSYRDALAQLPLFAVERSH